MNPIRLPEIWSYASNSANYGSHCMAMRLPGLITVYFSYKTPVAFAFAGHTVIRHNSWGPTTGKHLNAIDPDKNKRISGKAFEKLYEIAMTEPQLDHDAFAQKIKDVTRTEQATKEALAA